MQQDFKPIMIPGGRNLLDFVGSGTWQINLTFWTFIRFIIDVIAFSKHFPVSDTSNKFESAWKNGI